MKSLLVISHLYKPLVRCCQSGKARRQVFSRDLSLVGVFCFVRFSLERCNFFGCVRRKVKVMPRRVHPYGDDRDVCRFWRCNFVGFYAFLLLQRARIFGSAAALMLAGLCLCFQALVRKAHTATFRERRPTISSWFCFPLVPVCTQVRFVEKNKFLA